MERMVMGKNTSILLGEHFEKFIQDQVILNPLLVRRGGTNEYATKEQTIEGRGGGINNGNHHPVSRHSLCSV